MDKSKNLKRELVNISKKTGKGKVAIYYSNKQKIKRFSTGVECLPEYFDKKNAQVLDGGVSAVGRVIVDNLYNSILKIINDHLYKFGELPAVTYVNEQLEKPSEAPADIWELFDEYLQQKKEGIEPATYRKISLLQLHLKAADKKYKYNLNLNNLNYTFIQKFVTYLRDVRKNKNSSIQVRLSDLDTFVKWLGKKEIKHNIKPQLWDIPDNNSPEDFLCLERDELNAIIAYEPSPKQHKATYGKEVKTKDIIIFLSHTGVRVGDLKRIKEHHIQGGCINFLPEKTKNKSIRAIIPITRPVRELLERYNYKIPHYKGNKEVNENIRSLCGKIKELQKEIPYTELVENKQVTKMVPKYSVLDSHAVGRKTFINLCIERKVQLTTIAGMTGHTKIDTIMKHYADKHANKQTALAEVFEM